LDDDGSEEDPAVKHRAVQRRIINRVMLGLTALCAFVTVSLLISILGYLAWQGASSVNWAFFTRLPKPVGESGGGMANAIIGSGKLLFVAALTGIPIGFLGGVYLAESGAKSVPFVIRYTADVLNGVPSIVIGIFAYTLIVLPMHRFSAVAGGLALGVMLIPIVVRSTEEFLRAVPNSLREAALALGASKWRTVASVVIPAALRGIITGILISLARVAGETAPLLFTSFNNRFWSSGWDQPTSSLPVMIYTYAISPYEDWHRQAWAAGFVLLTLVLVINISVRLVLSRNATPRQG
jgi:phosphate transport system permease protein